MTHPEIPDTAVLAAKAAAKARDDDDEDAMIRAMLAAALPLLTAHRNQQIEQLINHGERDQDKIEKLEALNAALLDVARGAKWHSHVSRPEDCEICKALAHPLVQQAMKASEPVAER